MLADSVTCMEVGCFLGKSSQKSRSGGLTVTRTTFTTTTQQWRRQTLVSLSFLPVTDTVFQAEIWQRVSKTDRRTGRRTDRRTDTSSCITAAFFSSQVAKDSYSYYVTVVWFCNVAHVSLYLVEWRTCAVIRLSDRHILDMLPAYPFTVVSPVLCLWYLHHRLISTGAKFHPSPPPRHSHRGRELAQDSCIQTAVWMGLVSKGHIQNEQLPLLISSQSTHP